jgi:hypothetical protein
MANALTVFDSGQMPAHIAALNDEAANIVPRATINALGFEGKVWSISLDGKKTQLMRTNQEGEEEPMPIFTGVILDYTKNRGREFYAGVYDPKKPAIPDCWSEDGKIPHANVAAPVSKACDSCPKSKKGSQIRDDGRSSTACSPFQKLAIVPMAKLGQFPPLRLRIKITSIYDKDGQDSHPGWYGFDQYLALLVSKNVRHTAIIPTKIKFDPSVAYPKLLFAPGKDWLTEDQLDIVKPLASSDEVKGLLESTYEPSAATTGTKPLPEDDGEDMELPATMPAQAKPAAPARPAAPPPPLDEGEDNDDATAKAAATRAAVKAKADKAATAAAAAAAAKAAVAAAASAAAAAEDNEDYDGATTVMPPPKASKPAGARTGAAKGTTAVAPLNAPAELGELLTSWDD